jgi:transposase
MWHSGIDQHKQVCVITTYGPEGPRVKQSRVASTPLEVARYFAEFPGPHKAVVESTGGWYWLADTLADLGVELVLAHATRVKAIAAAKVKTDKVDSDTLALLLRADLIPEAHMIAPAQRGPRDLMRSRLRLVEKCVSAQNSSDRLVEKFNVQTVAELDELYQLQAACHEAQIQLLTEQITTLERALHPYLIPNADVQRLLWIPGLGKVNAFTLYTEIDGIARFPSARQFFSYSRLVPGAPTRAAAPGIARAPRPGTATSSSRSATPGSAPYSTTPRSARSSKPKPGRSRSGSRARSSPWSWRASCITAHEAGGLQRAVQEPAAQSPETRAVAAPGQPTRLTPLAEGRALDWEARRRASEVSGTVSVRGDGSRSTAASR